MKKHLVIAVAMATQLACPARSDELGTGLEDTYPLGGQSDTSSESEASSAGQLWQLLGWFGLEQEDPD